MPSSPPGRPDRTTRIDNPSTSDPGDDLPVHSHSSTGDAYDASNCRDDHHRAIVLIEAERVVGLAWAWPIAVTAECGVLHYTTPDTDIAALLVDAGYCERNARQAVAVAIAKGFPVRAEFARFI